MQILLLCIALLLPSFCLAATSYDSLVLDSHFNTKELKLIRLRQNSNHYVSFIMDESKNVFIVKQAKSESLGKYFSFATEAFGAYIAKVNGILANQVWVIPAGYQMIGKIIKEMPATLHTLVPGQPVSKFPNLLELRIKLGQGIMAKTIHSMSLHPDIPLIVALDAFIANIDRGKGNFFYEKDSGKFWLIDFENSFNRSTCKLSCNFVNTVLEDKIVQFSPQELNGLSIFRDTLKKLVKRHALEELHDLFDLFIAQAGIVPGSALCNNKVVKRIQLYKNAISENYANAKELIGLLDILIARHKVAPKRDFYRYKPFYAFPLEHEPCGCSQCQNMALPTGDLGCSRDQLDSIIDRMQAYNHAFS